MNQTCGSGNRCSSTELGGGAMRRGRRRQGAFARQLWMRFRGWPAAAAGYAARMRWSPAVVGEDRIWDARWVRRCVVLRRPRRRLQNVVREQRTEGGVGLALSRDVAPSDRPYPVALPGILCIQDRNAAAGASGCHAVLRAEVDVGP